MITVALLLTSRLDPFRVQVLKRVFESAEIEIAAACVDARAQPSPAVKLRRELRKGRGGYVLVQGLRALREARREPAPSAADYLRERGVPTLETGDAHSVEVERFLRAAHPDCVARLGFGIIGEPLLSLAPKGVVSFHHGDIRAYRGQPAGFWELYNGERSGTVTVQVLTPALDAGRIVCERRVRIERTDTWSSVRRKLFDASRDMLVEACLLLEREDFEPTALADHEIGALYTTPNLRQWVTLQLKVGARKLTAALPSPSTARRG